MKKLALLTIANPTEDTLSILVHAGGLLVCHEIAAHGEATVEIEIPAGLLSGIGLVEAPLGLVALGLRMHDHEYLRAPIHALSLLPAPARTTREPDRDGFHEILAHAVEAQWEQMKRREGA